MSYLNNLSVTWPNDNADRVAIGYSVTDNGAAATSSFMRFKRNLSTVFDVSKLGALAIAASLAVGQAIVADVNNGLVVWSAGYLGISNTATISNAGIGVPDVRLYRDAANSPAFRNGTNAQALRIYNTWANAGVDYERGFIGWASNILTIGTEYAGTGSQRYLKLSSWADNLEFAVNGSTRITLASTQIVPQTDAAIAFGANTRRWTTGWFSSTINQVGGTIAASTPGLAISQTWNNSGVTFKAMTISITDPAANAGSAAASMAFEINAGTAGTTNIFGINKTGTVTLRAGSSSSIPTIQAGSDNYISVLASGGFDVLKSSGAYGLSVDVSNSRAVLYNGLSLSFAPGNSAPDTNIFRDAAGVLAQRNGTNAQLFKVYNSYTDSSNNSGLSLGANGGSIELKAITAGTGPVNMHLYLTPAGVGAVFLPSACGIGWSSSRAFIASPADGVLTITNSAGTGFTGLLLGPSGTTYNRIKHEGTGIVSHKFADDSGYSDVKLRSIIMALPSSVTPASNGDVQFEFTDNTHVTIKAKGSDGVVRSGAVTLS